MGVKVLNLVIRRCTNPRWPGKPRLKLSLPIQWVTGSVFSNSCDQIQHYAANGALQKSSSAFSENEAQHMQQVFYGAQRPNRKQPIARTLLRRIFFNVLNRLGDAKRFTIHFTANLLVWSNRLSQAAPNILSPRFRQPRLGQPPSREHDQVEWHWVKPAFGSAPR